MPKETKSSSKESKKSNKGLITILIVAVVLVGLVLAGRFVYKMITQKVAGGILSRVTGQNVDISGGGENIKIKTEKGDLTINSGGALPSSFPKDFPIYPGAKLTGSFSASGDEDSTGVSVVWETGDDPAKVGAYYKTQLVASGYTIVTEYMQDDSTTLTFEKGNTSGFMGVGGDEGKTAISVTMGTK